MFYIALEPRFDTRRKVDNVLLDGLQVEQLFVGDFPVELFALCYFLFVIRGLPLETLFLFGIALNAVVIQIDGGFHARPECIRNVVFCRLQTIDSVINCDNHFFSGGVSVVFFKFAVERRQTFVYYFNRFALILDGQPRRIPHSLFRRLSKLALAVRILLQKRVKLFYGQIGQRLLRKRHIITHSEKVGTIERNRFGQNFFYFAERLRHGVVICAVNRLEIAREQRLDDVCNSVGRFNFTQFVELDYFRFQFRAARVYNILVVRFFRQANYILYFARKPRSVRVLFYEKQRVVYIGKSFRCAVERVVVSYFEFEVFTLELIEICTQLLVCLRRGLVARACRVHALI